MHTVSLHITAASMNPNDYYLDIKRGPAPHFYPHREAVNATKKLSAPWNCSSSVLVACEFYYITFRNPIIRADFTGADSTPSESLRVF